jgi:hypothetical protein
VVVSGFYYCSWLCDTDIRHMVLVCTKAAGQTQRFKVKQYFQTMVKCRS